MKKIALFTMDVESFYNTDCLKNISLIQEEDHFDGIQYYLDLLKKEIEIIMEKLRHNLGFAPEDYKLKRMEKAFPVGKVEMINMYPMDFEEFAWALGDDMLISFIKHCFDKQQPLGPLMHRKAMDMFKEYMIVGGMPQAVCRYVESNKNFGDVDKVKRDILSLYKSDIEKYASGFETKVKSIFEQLPATLQRHEKKFRLQDIQSSARFREYETSFFWLEESQVVNICWGATEPSLGLRMKMDTQQLKCYMACF